MKVTLIIASLILPIAVLILFSLSIIVPSYASISMSITNGKIIYPAIVSFNLKVNSHSYFGCFYYFYVIKFIYNGKTYTPNPIDNYYAFDGKPNSFSVAFYMPSKLYAQIEHEKSVTLTIVIKTVIITSLNTTIDKIYNVQGLFQIENNSI
ncbi:hypothetical protein [Acidianus manzaensis]|uniref:Uncharacterized protein n=1 Tax=Acidianus manzaensis TaxID=282676 RepID=A0A1W6JWW4_9CREN|nr:hypothetical protein [Acidianus manzaensis]ARM74737.1 hypothetical protein B6F84_00985 [Acidianus manzaensis]